MSNTVLIIGQSGTGKSTSIRNLNPETTFIINVLDKPLPFKGFKKKYIALTKSNSKGNYFSSDDWQHILKCIDLVSKERPEIDTLIIDDMQYILANEFMRRSHEKGFDKYSEMANHYWQIINKATASRKDLLIVFMSHSETDAQGRSKTKTIGKLLEEKIAIEGMFTTLLHSLVVEGEYKFLTQFDGEHLAKSPMDMFMHKFIDNDLCVVKEHMENYFNQDEELSNEIIEESKVEEKE